MKYYFKVKVGNDVVDIGINRPELIYGATGIIVGKKIEGDVINPVTKEKNGSFLSQSKRK